MSFSYKFETHGYFTMMLSLFRGDSVSRKCPRELKPMHFGTIDYHPVHIEPIVKVVALEPQQSGIQQIAGIGYNIGYWYLCHFIHAANLTIAFMT